MSVRKTARASSTDVELQHQIMQLRQPDGVTNLVYLAREYVCLAAVIGGAIAFAESRAGWGLAWGWNVPVFALAIILVGGLQHRLAGLGHESSHYTFVKNRFLNDLIPDLFCMFPILTSVHFYRVFHMAHHQHTNDPEKDPDLLNLGRGKRAFEFPMTRERFIATVYFCMVVAPLRFVEYQFAYMTVNTLGKGRSIYNGTAKGKGFAIYVPKLSTILGVLYILAVNGLFLYLTQTDRVAWIAPAALTAAAVGVFVAYTLPDRFVFQSPFRQAYSTRFAGSLRLCFFIGVLAVLASLRWATDGRSAIYATSLWIVPLLSSFPFFMFLRDVYQHSNADAGRLTNSRVFFVDPFTRWAVFIYGQDMHIPHHLYPTVPHYRLGELHELLKSQHADYGRLVVECHGTFVGDPDHPTILDEMTKDRPPLLAGAAQG